MGASADPQQLVARLRVAEARTAEVESKLALSRLTAGRLIDENERLTTENRELHEAHDISHFRFQMTYIYAEMVGAVADRVRQGKLDAEAFITLVAAGGQLLLDRERLGRTRPRSLALVG
jgi:hypothetical protein